MSAGSPSFDPNISRLKRLAKDLKRAVEQREPEALARVDAAGVVPKAPFPLRSAQRVIANEHGYASWHGLIEAAGEKLVDERDLHRWFGVSLNNAAWKALGDGVELVAGPPHVREDVLYRAYASAYHWMQAGTPIHHARAEHLIARTALAVGEHELARRHALRHREIVERHPDLAEDWDHAFVEEIDARSLAALNRTDEARERLREAESRCAEVVDPEDRAVVEAELARGPWFGVR